jgi:hypothetical protein
LALARWPTFAAVLARAFALHDGCHFRIVVFLLLSIDYGIRRGRTGLWKVVHRCREKVGPMAVLLRSFRIFLEFPAFSGFF